MQTECLDGACEGCLLPVGRTSDLSRHCEATCLINTGEARNDGTNYKLRIAIPFSVSIMHIFTDKPKVRAVGLSYLIGF